MYPVIEIFGKEIGVYGLCAVIGLLVCGFVVFKLGKKENIVVEDVILVVVVAGVGLFLGGSILYGITNIKYIITAISNMSEYGLWGTLKIVFSFFSGSVFYGGFITSLILVRIYLKKRHFEIKERFFDIYIVCVPLFHFFGRIGCFFGGCCYGKEGSWGFIVNDNHLVPEINGVMRIPVPLIEAVGNLCIFFLLLYLFKKGKNTIKLMYVYMIVYPVMRFILEFYRGDKIRGIWYGLSTSQWISIVLFVFAVTSVIIKRKKIKI